MDNQRRCLIIHKETRIIRKVSKKEHLIVGPSTKTKKQSLKS